VDRSRIAVVIPAFNEACTIAQVVSAAAAYGRPVVVDDGSSDATGELAAAAGAQVVRHPANRGYDAALDSGFAYASRQGCDCIVTVDADGQHRPSLIGEFVSAIEAGADVVVGVRDRRQRFGEHLFAWVGRMLWGVRDPLCGMKAYRASVYRALGHFDAYGSIGTELCLFAVRRGMTIAQVPVPTRSRVDAPRFGRRWAANLKILRALALAIARR
jgi:glycosyltransferase involved in cell wall biosynthesis